MQNFPFVLPPSVPSGTPEAEKWLAEARMRYGQAQHRVQMAKQKMHNLQTMTHQQLAAGKSFTPEEQTDLNQKRVVFQRAFNEATRYLEGFHKQQLEFKAQAQGQNAAGAVSSGASASQSQSVNTTDSSQPQASQASVTGPNTQPSSGAAQAGSSGQNLDAVMEDQQEGVGPDVPASASPPGGMMQSQASQGAGGTSVPVSGPGVSTGPAPAIHSGPGRNLAGDNTELNQGARYASHLQTGIQRQPTNSPQSARPPSATALDRPQPLTHHAAFLQAARSHSNGIPSPNHAHPATVPDTNTQKMPIPKNLNVQPPQPVSMNPARPTYTGGAGTATNSVVNQPALPKLPGYVLEGEGERVLSKKKLDELVRQVSNGGEGLGGQLLTPECEEVSIEGGSVRVMLGCSSRYDFTHLPFFFLTCPVIDLSVYFHDYLLHVYSVS